MILLPIFLSVVLDMSLPEFQPQTDLSGNYVIGEYDVTEGDFEVIAAEELPDGLTVEAPTEDVELSLLGDTRALETNTITASVKDLEDPSNNDPGGGDVSGDDISGNQSDNPSGCNFDDTALLEVLHDIQMQLRCILFVCIWRFILPLAMKIRDHVFGLKHE